MTTPFMYQIAGARGLHFFGGRALLADDTGLGKTFQTLLWMSRHPDYTRPAVVVCPAPLKYQWEREFDQHFGWRAEVLESKTPDRVLKGREFVIVNYDILPEWTARIKEMGLSTVIVDECHYIKNKGTKRYKAVRNLARGVKNFVAISATPITIKPVEFWNILNLLRPDLFPDFFQFAFRYCDPRRTPWGWEFNGSKNMKELHQLLVDSVMIRRRKADVMDHLPAKIRTVVPLPLSNRPEYEHAHRAFLNWLAKRKPGKVSAAERAERLVKVGYLKRLAADLKMPAVLKWTDNFYEGGAGGKLLQFAEQISLVERMHLHRKGRSVIVNGQVTGRRRQDAVDKFQNDRNTDHFSANIVAGGIGLNLTAAETVCFVEFPWAPATLTQAEDRCYARVSDLHGANVYYLVAAGTIEERQVAILQSRQKSISEVLDGDEDAEQYRVFDLLMEEMQESVN